MYLKIDNWILYLWCMLSSAYAEDSIHQTRNRQIPKPRRTTPALAAQIPRVPLKIIIENINGIKIIQNLPLLLTKSQKLRP